MRAASLFFYTFRGMMTKISCPAPQAGAGRPGDEIETNFSGYSLFKFFRKQK